MVCMQPSVTPRIRDNRQLVAAAGSHPPTARYCLRAVNAGWAHCKARHGIQPEVSVYRAPITAGPCAGRVVQRPAALRGPGPGRNRRHAGAAAAARGRPDACDADAAV